MVKRTQKTLFDDCTKKFLKLDFVQKYIHEQLKYINPTSNHRLNHRLYHCCYPQQLPNDFY